MVSSIMLKERRRAAGRRLLSAGEAALGSLPAKGREEARLAAELILAAHNGYLETFNAITAMAQGTFETRAWAQGAIHAEQRVRLYRDAVDDAWRKLKRQFEERAADHGFWLAARHLFLERAFDRYDVDLALTFFYSTMRLAFDAQEIPVEYDDDGLAERWHASPPEPIWRRYSARPERLRKSIEELLAARGFRARFEDAARDAARVAERLLCDWGTDGGAPRELRMLEPTLFRDREAYLAGKLLGPKRELPVVLALRHDGRGIAVDAVLSGREDMRNILFVSTRSTFHARTDAYRETLAFLDTLAPERGHPAMCAVLGFTHPARVALNQRLQRHLRVTDEKFGPAPGRTGMAMVVFSPPSFPYVFKVVRDFSGKEGWMGRAHIMDLYRWVHEMNRGRLMLDAWVYRNLHFPREAFEESVLADLLSTAPFSVRLDGDTVVLRHVYAQRRVQPLNTFFDQTADRGERERVADALGAFIKDLAWLGFFVGDHYGLTFNTGLTHGRNVTLFDFDDLAPLSHYRFRETPRQDERDELLWNSEVDGAWFAVEENDVLVDEWERFLGIPDDLRDCFRARHGDLFTLEYWTGLQRRVMGGEVHYVLPYPVERRLDAGETATAP